METLIDLAVLSVLEGFDGSHPRIVLSFPQPSSMVTADLIYKTLPSGAIPLNFYESTLNNRQLLSYSFACTSSFISSAQIRKNLVSLSFRLAPETNMDEVKGLLKMLISELDHENILTLEMVQKSLPAIAQAFNSQSPLKFAVEISGKKKDFVFDVKTKLNGKSLIKKNERKVKGGLL